ncbi:carbohydrate binding domain-containing protein, partial [Kitasatospora sp. NPDC058263]
MTGRARHRRRSTVAVLAAAAALTAGLLSTAPLDTAATAATTASTATGSNTATVFYYTKTHNWSTYNLHWAPDGGSWTATPGTAMQAACTDWVKKTVDLGSASGLQATFNNGAGTWDSNGGKNYALGTGVVTVKDGVVGSAEPCGTDGSPGPSPSASSSPSTSPAPSTSPSSSASPSPSGSSTPPAGNSATVFYSTAAVGWSTVNLHYAPTGGAWTAVPGVGMELACPGWFKRTVPLGSATGMAATFNNGLGTWDNNNGNNYVVPAGISTVQNSKVTANTADPCAGVKPDTTAPSVPGSVNASATDTSIVLTWEPSTDDTRVTGYQITRTGGTMGASVINAGSTVYSDTGLEARTVYTYTVKALDAAGNVSAASAAAVATTGDAPPPAKAGEMIGTDPRKDPIYFVLTAR